MKDQLSGQVDLQSLFDPHAAHGLIASLALKGANVGKDATAECGVMGSPQFDDEDSAAAARVDGLASGLLLAWHKHGTAVTARLRGGYAIAVVDTQKQSVFLAVDRFAIQTLCYHWDGQTLAFSDRADCVAAGGKVLDAQAVFDYLFFHVIPAPRTIFRNVLRLPAAHSLLVDRRGTHLVHYWQPKFNEKANQPFPQARDTLKGLISAAVAEEVTGHKRVGAFLSGGIDSSTVAGTMRQLGGTTVPAYSIGFEAEGYDEMEYARLAARHFGCEHHEYYVTPADLLASIPAVAQHHDQPFGNSSALPAYYCTRMALSDGCTKMLAGDGGDELFGGNARYAMQRFLNLYQSVPNGVRQMIEPLCGDNSVLRKVPGLRQAAGYVRHSKVPMPHRMQNLNLIMQLDPAKVLTADFLARIDIAAPARNMQGTWDECQAPGIVDRILAYDWRYTLADCDLPKVRGAAEMAGVGVGYPLLADRLVDFSTTLPSNWKVRGFKLRWFFKEAMRGFLPDEIIAKKKQGFGLPYGPWLLRDPQLRELARASLYGLAARGIVQSTFVTSLLDQHLQEHPGYYGEMIWILMMLEQWLQGQGDISFSA
jgi:asparagine synthase (glutamine-hydrolysing)